MPQQRKHQSDAQRQAAYRQRASKVREAQVADRGLPSLPAIPSMPGEKRWRAGIVMSELLLSTLSQEMREYYEERSEVWQESERGEAFSERIESIEEVAEALSQLLN